MGNPGVRARRPVRSPIQAMRDRLLPIDDSTRSAQALWIGLSHGYYRGSDAIRWADAQITALDHPSEFLIDLSMSSASDVTGLLGLLEAEFGRPDDSTRLLLGLGFLRLAVANGANQASAFTDAIELLHSLSSVTTPLGDAIQDRRPQSSMVLAASSSRLLRCSCRPLSRQVPHSRLSLEKN